MVYAGTGSYAYCGPEDGGFGTADPLGDPNLPINRMLTVNLPKVYYPTSYEYSYDKLDPSDAWNETLEEGTFEWEGRYNAPFMLQFVFTHHAVGGVWASGTGTLTFDYTDVDDDISFWIQIRLADQVGTNHIDRLFKGCDIVEYSWEITQGSLVMEKISGIAADVATNTQAMVLADTFHDQAFGSGVGGHANWVIKDDSNRKPYHATEAIVTYGGAAFSNFNLTEATIKLTTPKTHERTLGSLKATADRWLEKRDPYEGSVKGRLTNNTQLVEFEKAYESKTPQTYKVQLGTTTNQWIQVTNMIIEDLDILEIPEAGQAWEVSMILKSTPASVASYGGSFVNHPDPTALIWIAP